MLTAEQLAAYLREKARFNDYVNRTGIIENEKLHQAADTIDQQAALLAKYREALEFYANPNIHDIPPCQLDSDVERDGGKRARDALEAGMAADKL